MNQSQNHRGTNIYVGTFLIAFSTLALEITLSRILSVTTFYHLAFFAVSTAMLGMTAGAATVYLMPHWFSDDKLNSSTAKSCLGYSISVPVALILLCLIPVSVEFSLMKSIALLVITVACSLPFYFSGITVSVVLTKYDLPIGKLYASDLIGASLGCLFVLGGLEFIDAPGLIMLCGAIGILSVFSFSYKTADFHGRTLSIIVLLILLVGTVSNLFSTNSIYPMIVKGRMENPAQYSLIKWNSFSRVVVQSGLEGFPQNWGPSPVMPKNFYNVYYQMNIDGEAGTVLTRFQKPEDIDYLKYDITNAAYYIRPPEGNACILGVGGGRDILSAIRFGYKNIVGVDVNPIFIDMLENKYRNEANIANHEGVKLVVDEARSYLTKSDEKFSFIQMSLIDTWASTGAGAFTLTENSLYTLEAWKVIIEHLNDKGLFTLSRWYSPNNLGETGRTVSLAMAVLFRMGVENPSRHIAMFTVGKVSTLIISKAPFDENDINKLKEISSSLGYNLILSPGEFPSNEVLKNIISSVSIDELFRKIKDEPLNYIPPTDNNPYFFNMLKLSHLGEAYHSETGIIRGNLIASVTLIVLIVILFVLTIITVIIPLIYGRKRIGSGERNKKMFWLGALYFSMIGAGFMMIEIGLMQRLSVFLGHPVYALGILLFTIILSSGIGSFISEKLALQTSPWKYIFPAFVAVGTIALNIILDIVIADFIPKQTRAGI